MFTSAKIFLFVSAILFALSGVEPKTAENPSVPEYTSDAQLKMPENYREWVYLTTGFDMSYTEGGGMPDQHTFDNVFVNPESYKAFLATGKWPDKTMLVLENRVGQGKGSINQKGNFQTDISGIEVHVRDETLPGNWGFYVFSGDKKTTRKIPTAASCYTCHQAHAAVDTTFVQFYPTLMPIAKGKQTLSEAYKHEQKGPE